MIYRTERYSAVRVIGEHEKQAHDMYSANKKLPGWELACIHLPVAAVKTTNSRIMFYNCF